MTGSNPLCSQASLLCCRHEAWRLESIRENFHSSEKKFLQAEASTWFSSQRPPPVSGVRFVFVQKRQSHPNDACLLELSANRHDSSENLAVAARQSAAKPAGLKRSALLSLQVHVTQWEEVAEAKATSKFGLSFLFQKMSRLR